MSGQGYSAELRLIEKELKISNKKSNDLRKRKKIVSEKLYNYMCKYNLTAVDGYSREKLEPPAPKPEKKTESQKRRDAMELFEQVGIRNVDQFYQEFARTQKSNAQLAAQQSGASGQQGAGGSSTR